MTAFTSSKEDFISTNRFQIF